MLFANFVTKIFKIVGKIISIKIEIPEVSEV